jgi:spermidine synthase
LALGSGRKKKPKYDPVLDWAPVETAYMADGAEFVLTRDRHEWIVRVDECVLMSNLMHGSEDALAALAIGLVDDPTSVLVGGLGLGYTLRAALDCVSTHATVTLVEIIPELVEWNEKHLHELNGAPLRDPRCRVIVDDVFNALERSPGAFDVILLDVDNSPKALAQAQNHRLYMEAGVRVCHAALKPGGVLGVWSKGPCARYERQLETGSFEVDVRAVPAMKGSEMEHVIFLAKAAG